MVCPMAWRKDLDKPLVALEFLAGFQGSAVAVACWSRPSVVRIPGTRHLRSSRAQGARPVSRERVAVSPWARWDAPTRAIAHYGFMERPDIPRLLGQLEKRGCTIDLADVTYFVGHETVIRREDRKGCRVGRKRCLPSWSAMPPT